MTVALDLGVFGDALVFVVDERSLILARTWEHLLLSGAGCRLEHCGTNILASRLKDLERGGVLRRRRLPPPAAATVYELTEYGEGLRAVMHQLAHWGARSLDPPSASEELAPGWLTGALRTALPPDASDACIEFRIGDEIATWAPGDVRAGSSERADVVVEGDPADLFHFFVDRDDRGLTVRGDRAVVTRLLERMPLPVPRPARTEPEPAAA